MITIREQVELAKLVLIYKIICIMNTVPTFIVYSSFQLSFKFFYFLIIVVLELVFLQD